MAVSAPHIEASRFADPCRVADVILAADAVYIEPVAMAADPVTPEPRAIAEVP